MKETEQTPKTKPAPTGVGVEPLVSIPVPLFSRFLIALGLHKEDLPWGELYKNLQPYITDEVRQYMEFLYENSYR